MVAGRATRLWCCGSQWPSFARRGGRSLQQALEAKGPILVDVVTNPSVLPMPPKATIQQAKGFALPMIRTVFTAELDDVLDAVMANGRNVTWSSGEHKPRVEMYRIACSQVSIFL